MRPLAGGESKNQGPGLDLVGNMRLASPLQAMAMMI